MTHLDLNRDKGALLAELTAAGAIVRGGAITCPFHNDRHPSGAVYESGGVWRYKCHGGECGFCGDIWDARGRVEGKPLDQVLAEANVGNDWKSVTPRTAKPVTTYPTLDALTDAIERFARSKNPDSRIVEVNPYTNPDNGNCDLVTVKLRPGKNGRDKDMSQGHQRPDGYVIGGAPKPLPLFNRKRLRDSESVVVVEGEKDVRTLHRLGFIGTTSPGGAGKAKHADWTPLAGKIVYLWPDAIDGEQHMRDVQQELLTLDPLPRVFWIEPDGLKLSKGGDVSDFVERFANDDEKRQAVQMVIDSAEPLGASSGLHRLIEDTIAGKRRIVHLPYAKVSNVTRALMPGTVLLLGGDPGSVKSLSLNEIMRHIHCEGEKIALLELEDGRAFHLNRTLAQISGCSDITDPDWVTANADDARELYAIHADFLDAFGARMHEPPAGQMTLDQVAEWVEKRAAEGCRIIAVDPITAAEVKGDQWTADARFMMRIKAAAEEHGASIVVVTHPKKGAKQPGLDSLAGGAAFARFSHTVLWLRRYSPAKAVVCATMQGNLTFRANAEIVVYKTRNGKCPPGTRVAFEFSTSDLGLHELGLVTTEEEHTTTEHGVVGRIGAA